MSSLRHNSGARQYVQKSSLIETVSTVFNMATTTDVPTVWFERKLMLERDLPFASPKFLL